ncbi:cd7 antigen-like [Megalops cyprinoides]|uniref:cd7 antigen-like n=1 Tax=Megalops cyprinoides TaxID=118141 RepID=UPI00186416D1|nr:cd7 antigen-like [Megalops cyprinoides]
MKMLRFALWMFLVMPIIFASEDVLYFRRQEGESVDLPCEQGEKGTPPIGLYLKRTGLGPEKEVMFFSDRPQVMDPADEDRIHVHGSLSANLLNVTISQLQRKDTALYYCQFVYNGHPKDEFMAGKKSFFLFVEVEGIHCSCSSYPPLLYAISAAVGLLLLILICLGATQCCKSCKQRKPQTLVPIYEEMAGVQPANGKAPRSHLETLHQEETDHSMYASMNDNPQIKQRQENHYVSPRGTRLPLQSSATSGEEK